MRILYKVFVAIISIISALLLLGASFASYLGPSKFPFLTVLGLSYEYLVFLNLAVILLAAFKNKYFAILPLVAIGYGFPKPIQIVQFNSPEPVQVADKNHSVKILSYNVHLFNKALFVGQYQLRDSIESFLVRQKADIYFIQEFYHNEKKKASNNFERIPLSLGTPYNYFEHDKGKNDKPNYFFGAAIFSKYPIIEKGVVVTYNGGKAQAVYADIETPAGIVRTYNIHLQSLGFDDEEYDFLKRAHGIEIERAFDNSKSVYKKIIAAAKVRVTQTMAIEDHMRGCEYPIIMAGDFNETPFSFNTHSLRKYMRDGFIRKGKGMGTTFEGVGFLPPLRIDYILTSRGVDFLDFQTHDVDFSDHRPLTATLKF